MGRVLDDRARAAAAVRQRRAGESRGAPRAGAVARRPRRVGARARHDLPGPPHRQPLDVSCRRRDSLAVSQVVALRLALPELGASVVPAGSYPSLTRHYQTVGLYNFVVAHRTLPDDLVYGI